MGANARLLPLCTRRAEVRRRRNGLNVPVQGIGERVADRGTRHVGRAGTKRRGYHWLEARERR